MANYKSQYTGAQIDEAVGKVLDGVGTKLYAHDIYVAIPNDTAHIVLVGFWATPVTTIQELTQQVNSPYWCSRRVMYRIGTNEFAGDILYGIYSDIEKEILFIKAEAINNLVGGIDLMNATEIIDNVIPITK